LAGTYDLQTGVMTLPNSSFQASGTAPSADLKATLKLQDMSLRLGHSSYLDAANISQPVTKDMLDNLQNTMNGSPVLAQQMKEAVNATFLEKIVILDPKVGAGGTYSDRFNTMSLPATSLQTSTPSNPLGAFHVIDMTFVLGHEIQHGFNAAEKANATQIFKAQMTQIAQSNNPIHDYTPPIGMIIEAGRKDEAKAEIAGWNAVLSNLQVSNSAAGLTEMFNTNNTRMRDFVVLDAVGTVIAKSGLSFNPNATLPQTPGNIEGMGVHYFDKPPAANSPNLPAQQTTNLGFYRESDYANSYGASAVSNVINFERALSHPVNGIAPQLHINMTQLHLEERLMERLGISIGTNPNTPQKYYDTSQTPPAVHHFDHTNTTGTPTSHQHVPVVPALPTRSPTFSSTPSQQDTVPPEQPNQQLRTPAENAPDAPSAGPPSRADLDPRDRDHPDFVLHQQALNLVHNHDEKLGRIPDENSERLAASLTLLAKENGISRIDNIVFSIDNGRGVKAGENVFVVQGELGNPAHDRAHMKTTEAINTSVSESFQKMEVINQQQTQQQLQQPAVEQTQAPQQRSM
jgi:hypothetical protein